MKLIHSVKIRSRKFLAGKKSSSPFLSSDAFIELCSHKFKDEKSLLSAVSNAQKTSTLLSVFVKTDKAQQFYETSKLYRLEFNSVLYGDSDLDLDLDCIPFSQINQNILVQNQNFSHERVHPLPIGIENLSRFYNGRPELFGKQYFDKEKNRKVLVGPFGATHDDRRILNSLSSDEYLTVSPTRMSPDEYARYSSDFQFIACPRGNGLDTHRFWESLYRGSIPIVLDSIWSQYIRRLNIPVLIVNKWDREEISQAVVSCTWSTFNPTLIDPLWIEYWQERLSV